MHLSDAEGTYSVMHRVPSEVTVFPHSRAQLPRDSEGSLHGAQRVTGVQDGLRLGKLVTKVFWHPNSVLKILFDTFGTFQDPTREF